MDASTKQKGAARGGKGAGEGEEGGKVSPYPIRCNGRTRGEVATEIHGRGLLEAVYMNAMRPGLSRMIADDMLDRSASEYIEDMSRRMAPRDPVEEMLVHQMLLAHTRAMHLTVQATAQTELDGVRIVNEYADRAANSCRRLALALAEYRRPVTSKSFTAIRQANIAAQQVVQNQEFQNGNATIEQGYGNGGGVAAAIPADAGGVGVAAGIGGPGEAVGAIYGAADAGG